MKQNTISSMEKTQLLLMKRSMSKKAYRDACKRYRNKMTLYQNFGTRIMASKRDIERKYRSNAIKDCKILMEEKDGIE